MAGRTLIIRAPLSEGKLASSEAVVTLLKGLVSLLQSKTQAEPVVIQRTSNPSGFSGFIVSNNNRITVDTFDVGRKIEVQIYSFFSDIDGEIVGYLSRMLAVPTEFVKAQLVSDRSGRVECQEAYCTVLASMNWEGRHVCKDHYEQYQEKYENDLSSMNEY